MAMLANCTMCEAQSEPAKHSASWAADHTWAECPHCGAPRDIIDDGPKEPDVEVLVGNAFALSMLDPATQAGFGARAPRCPQYLGDAEDAKEWLRLNVRLHAPRVRVRSIIGHENTAAVFSSLLGIDLPMNRESVQLTDKQMLLVGQYSGPRLPEGATELPEGASIRWWLV